MLRNYKKHVQSPCRWLPFLGNSLLPWSIRREEDIEMEKRLHLESGRGIMEHFHTFSSFRKYFCNKRSCSAHTHLGQISDCFPLSFGSRTDSLPLADPLDAHSPQKNQGERLPDFFFLKRGEGVCTQPSLAWGLSNCFDLCVNCLLPLPLMKILSTHAVCQIWENFYFYFWVGGGGCWIFRVDTRFSGGKKSLLCIFFNMSSIKDPSISVFTGIGLFLFLFLPALILPNSNCLHKILFVKEGIKIF